MFVDFNILNQLGSPSINSNTFANRPAAGQTGRLFVSTDTFELYRDNGTGWDLIGGPGSSTVTGSGAAGQVTYWTGASTIGGNNNLFWDTANSRLGIGTATPGTKLDIHTTSGTAASLNSTNAVGNVYTAYQNQGTTQYLTGYTDDADINYRRFAIYDSVGAKEVVSIDQQSRYVGINYQYTSLADQPSYTLDVSGSARVTDNVFLATSGTAQVGINTTSPTQATALIEAVKTDGYGLFLNYATASGSGSTATALWTLNTTAGSGYSAVIEEKTANTTGGQYPLLIKHSLSSGTAGVGIGTGLHFALPDSTGTFKTTQLTVETTDAAASTYTTRYRFMAQVNGTSTALAYLTNVGLGIGNVIPSYKLDVNGVARVFGAGNTGRFLAVDTNVSGASVELNPQYGTGLPILQSVGSFPLLFGTNSVERARIDTAGNLGLGVTPSAWSVVTALQVKQASLNADQSSNITSIVNNAFYDGSSNKYIQNGASAIYQQLGGLHIWYNAPSGTAGNAISFTQAMTLDASGNLLVGKTANIASSRMELVVGGNGNGSLISLGVNNNANSFNLVCDSGLNALVVNKENTPMIFYTNNTRRIDITAGGNVLIGTTTDAGYKLNVNGATLVSGGTSGSQSLFEDYVGGLRAAISVRNAADFAGGRGTGYAIQNGNGVDKAYFQIRSTSGSQTTYDLELQNLGAGSMTIDSTGKTLFSSSIKTAAPTTGTAADWKLGSRVAATVVLSTTQYIEVDIGGTLYKLATVT